jgi:hypothetical protein
MVGRIEMGVSKTKTYENEDRRLKMGLRNYENEDPSLFSYYENEDPKIFIYIVFAKISVKVSRNSLQGKLFILLILI